jgi:hypothetical protein
MKPLVGDEIQHREINIGRGRYTVDGLVTMETFLTDIRLGASFHGVIVDLPSKDPE